EVRTKREFVGVLEHMMEELYDPHAHLGITEREWQAMLVDFRAVLDRFEVPHREQSELIAIVESTKADIVVGEERR
ncbi:MAG: hypothetical protein KY453_11725, partial [Gemmatimonadetes bacterium]|nr:hypothetical protein [Gemmatimonadota bacterium]